MALENLSEKISKLLILISLITIITTLGYAVIVTGFTNTIYMLLVLSSTFLVFAIIIYFANTELHHFVFVDEEGKPLKIKKKRLKKSLREKEVIEIDKFKCEIKPQNKIHIVGIFANGEPELRLDVKEAIAQARIGQRKLTMLDMTVQALGKLFSNNQLILLLLIACLIISATTLLIILFNISNIKGG